MRANRQKLAIALAVAMAGLAGCTLVDRVTGGGAGERVALSAQNEVPPAASTATGSGSVTVGSDCAVSANISVSGMTATAAHIHEGRAGANGPVLVPLTKSGDNAFVAAPGAKMTEAQCASYRAGNTYVNVHSDKFKGGEVRGQLKGR
jgi:hypothetical protein